MLTDGYARRFTYLRLSVTEACNFRCNYCLPNGTDCGAAQRAGELGLAEIRRLVGAFAQLGIRKVRLTGGEPSLRRDLAAIIALCKRTPGIETVALTTNGYRLERDLPAWREAGLDALNVSVDSLDPATFALITGHDRLRGVLAGIDLAQRLGLRRIKLNCVLLRDINHGEVDAFLAFVRERPLTLRLIELMRTGDNGAFFERHHLRGEGIARHLLAAGWQPLPRAPHAGPAQEYRHPDYRGGIGLITPYGREFCAGCNRLRVASDGRLFLCLFADRHHDLRPLLRGDDCGPLRAHLRRLVLQDKGESHQLHRAQTGATRHLAMIGG
jgi:cyclic pyranopterin phosphate synthase